MPNCELCGIEGSLVNAVVEGSVLQLCKRCKEFGDVVELQKPQVKPDKPKRAVEEPEEVVVDNYPALTKTAREQRALTQKDLAEKINEKESVIHKIESGHMRPSPELARKLERFLGIKLVESYTPANEKTGIDFKDRTLTIGDLVRLKKKDLR